MDFSVKGPATPGSNVEAAGNKTSGPAEPSSIEPQQQADHREQHAKPVAHGIPTSATAAQEGKYHAAVARIEIRLIAEKQLQTVGTANGLKLRPNYESIFRSQPNARGTVVMFHGYTAGPWQYKEMADQFAKAGYNVYIPRLPGHGFMQANGMGTGSELIKSTNRGAYEQYIDGIYQEASGLGAPVYVVGLSGGADIALRTAEKYPDVKGCAAMSPYLGPDGAGRLGLTTAYILDKLTFGLVGRILDHIPYGKNAMNKPDDPIPHTEGSLGQAMAMLSVGRNVRQVNVPVQYFTTQGDILAGSKPVGALYRHSGGALRDGWLTFPKAQQVPHAMLSKLEDKAPGVVDQLNHMVFQFIDQGKEFWTPPGSH